MFDQTHQTYPTTKPHGPRLKPPNRHDAQYCEDPIDVQPVR